MKISKSVNSSYYDYLHIRESQYGLFLFSLPCLDLPNPCSIFRHAHHGRKTLCSPGYLPLVPLPPCPTKAPKFTQASLPTSASPASASNILSLSQKVHLSRWSTDSLAWSPQTPHQSPIPFPCTTWPVPRRVARIFSVSRRSPLPSPKLLTLFLPIPIDWSV